MPLDSIEGTPRRSHLLGLIIGFMVLYGLTATWGYDANVDAIAAALPAWSLVEHGTLILDQFAQVNPWVVEGADGYVSNRPPGVFGPAIVAYFISGSATFSNGPATATAVLMTTACLAVLYVVLCRIRDERTAVIATIVFGVGTCTWQVSADALWPHGPGQLWAATALLAMSGRRYALTGSSLALSLLARPVTAVAAGVVGMAEGVRERSWRPIAGVGLPTLTALALLVLYNRVLFGDWSISGGYSEVFADRLMSTDLWGYLTNLAAVFFSPANGLLVWSPVVAIGSAGAVSGWRKMPGWVRSAAVAGLFYLVVHARLNRASGGVAFGYRYPLEPLVLATPALVHGATRIRELGRGGRMSVDLLIGVSIALQLGLVFALQCQVGPGSEYVCRLGWS